MLHKIHIIKYRWILTFQYLKITWYLSRQIFRPAQNLSNESKLDEGVTLCKLSVTPLGSPARPSLLKKFSKSLVVHANRQANIEMKKTCFRDQKQTHTKQTWKSHADKFWMTHTQTPTCKFNKSSISVLHNIKKSFHWSYKLFRKTIQNTGRYFSPFVDCWHRCSFVPIFKQVLEKLATVDTCTKWWDGIILLMIVKVRNKKYYGSPKLWNGKRKKKEKINCSKLQS